MWIVQSLEQSLFWTGIEWEYRAERARPYPSGEEAQKVADTFHLASCNYDHVLARATIERSQFRVIDYPTGSVYVPPPLIKVKHLLVRISEFNQKKKINHRNQL